MDIADVASVDTRTATMACFIVLSLLLLAARAIARSSRDASGARAIATARSGELVAFERRYMVAYLLAMAADWLQGPYVYELYARYGHDQATIASLFVVGFGSSMVAGTLVGSLADTIGRKRSCQAFCIVYALACIVKHSRRLPMLVGGRFLAGIATSILFSSFESWLVTEHHDRAYPPDHLSALFAMATSGNGIVAIGSGIAANIANDFLGPIGPFDLAALLLMIALVVITATWTENYGNRTSDAPKTIALALRRIASDHAVLRLGLAQSLFEASMYIFVFLWTPALQRSTNVGSIDHGWVFACFMLCTMLGSQAFAYLAGKADVGAFAPAAFILAATALVVPAATSSFGARIGAFFVFEFACGMFWPIMGVLRSRYVPDDVRSTVMTLFRLPLNAIVVLNLVYLDRINQSTVWIVCSAMLAGGCALQSTLPSVAARSSSTGSRTELVQDVDRDD